jgi:hypothetical protein
MNFNRLVETELREMLIVDLEKYESQHKITEGEKKELHDWVSDGHSPYVNPFCLSDEKGGPIDFLSAIRISYEMREERLEELSHFDDLKFERNDLINETKALKAYIEKLQSLLDAKELSYPAFEMPDEIPF